MPDYGKIAYEAYCLSSEGRSLISGAALPKWENLRDDIRNAWEAAAMAVLNHGDAKGGDDAD